MELHEYFIAASNSQNIVLKLQNNIHFLLSDTSGTTEIFVNFANLKGPRMILAFFLKMGNRHGFKHRLSYNVLLILFCRYLPSIYTAFY